MKSGWVRRGDGFKLLGGHMDAGGAVSSGGRPGLLRVAVMGLCPVCGCAGVAARRVACAKGGGDPAIAPGMGQIAI